MSIIGMRSRGSWAFSVAMVSAYVANGGTFALRDQPIATPYAAGPGRMRRLTAASLAALAPVPAADVMGLCA